MNKTAAIWSGVCAVGASLCLLASLEGALLQDNAGAYPLGTLVLGWAAVALLALADRPNNGGSK